MKINACKTNIRETFSHLKNRLFPRRAVYVAVDIDPPISNISKDVFEMSEPQKISHGVIITKNGTGGFDCTLEDSKQIPFADMFTLNHEKKKSSHITNLTNELEKVYYNGREFETLFKEQPHLSRTVGSLPQKWGKKIGASKEKRERVNELFSEFGKEFHSKVDSEYSTVNVDTKHLQDGLSEVLSTDVKISKLGNGAWGKTYKINVDSQDYVLKVYYNQCPRGYGSANHYHGNYHELSSAIWASKNDADNYAMFYMGRFGENNDGYMLTKYMPEIKENLKIYNGVNSLENYNFVFSNYLHKLACYDCYYNNFRNKKIIDFGYTVVSEAGRLDEKTYKLAHTLGRLIDENNSKDLAKVVAKYQGTKEFDEAKSFLQHIINRETIKINANLLKNKKDILKQVGLDYTPDIRYVLSKFIYPIEKNRGAMYLRDMYSKIMELPKDAFQQLYEKYNKVLGLNN